MVPKIIHGWQLLNVTGSSRADVGILLHFLDDYRMTDLTKKSISCGSCSGGDCKTTSDYNYVGDDEPSAIYRFHQLGTAGIEIVAVAVWLAVI
jgi:hypothetical protein